MSQGTASTPALCPGNAAEPYTHPQHGPSRRGRRNDLSAYPDFLQSTGNAGRDGTAVCLPGAGVPGLAAVGCLCLGRRKIVAPRRRGDAEKPGEELLVYFKRPSLPIWGVVLNFETETQFLFFWFSPRLRVSAVRIHLFVLK